MQEKLNFCILIFVIFTINQNRRRRIIGQTISQINTINYRNWLFARPARLVKVRCGGSKVSTTAAVAAVVCIVFCVINPSTYVDRKPLCACVCDDSFLLLLLLSTATANFIRLTNNYLFVLFQFSAPRTHSGPNYGSLFNPKTFLPSPVTGDFTNTRQKNIYSWHGYFFRGVCWPISVRLWVCVYDMWARFNHDGDVKNTIKNLKIPSGLMRDINFLRY